MCSYACGAIFFFLGGFMATTGVINRVPGGKIKVWDVTLTVAAGATEASATSQDYFCGKVLKVELDPGDMATSATLKGYEANTPLATSTRDHFINYTFPASQVELVIYPLFESSTLNTGGALTTKESQHYVVSDKLTLDLASATAADSVRVRVYVEE